MLDNKFMATLIALIIGVVAAYNIKKKDSFEGLGTLPSMVVRPSNTATNVNTGQSAAVFHTTQNFQAMLSPRMFGGSYPASINYNLPSEDHLAVIKTSPLGYAKMAHENYKNGSFREDYVPSCSTGGAYSANAMAHNPVPMMADINNGNYNEQRDQLYADSLSPQVSDMIPIGAMDTINAEGETDQIVTYNSLMFANRNSTLRSQGDWIRGDLPIVPCKTGWFQVSVNPSIDLNQGAMNVLGGLDNSTSKQMAALMYNDAYTTTVGGVNLNTQELQSVGAVTSDVSVSAYP